MSRSSAAVGGLCRKPELVAGAYSLLVNLGKFKRSRNGILDHCCLPEFMTNPGNSTSKTLKRELEHAAAAQL